MRYKLVLIMLISLTGCGTTAAVQEFQSYAEAFGAVEDASDVVLSAISASERSGRVALIDGEARDGISRDLPRDQISLFAPNADPPFVGAMRFAIRSVAEFNAVMLAYAEGRALGVLGSEISGLRTAGIGFDQTAAGADVSVADMSAGIRALNAGLEVLAGVGSREAFRTQLKASGDDLNRVLDTVLKHSDTAYKMLTRQDFADLREARALGPDQVPGIQDRIRTKREMLAEWLHLIELSQGALRDALAAIDAPLSSRARLVEAAVVAGDLRARARMIKRLAVEK